MQSIFLIGLSGSGKSTVGRLLAQSLGMPLYDIDTLVEEECGQHIPTIFARYGEQYFRACESRALVRAVQTTRGAVIATGGGIVTCSENRALMAERGIRIFLDVEPATALERLHAQHEIASAQGVLPETRPLLAGADPLAALDALLNTRIHWYKEAEFACSTQQKSAEQVVQEIIAMLIAADELDGVAPIVRHVRVGEGYDVVVDWGGIGRLAHYLRQLHVPARVFIITDSNIQRLYAQPVLQSLTRLGFTPHLYAIPAGETSKSQQQLSAIYDWLLEQRAERKETIIALGGGVVGDLVGFAAATYLRGVPLIQVPTSLLAQIDAAIGGKTGINHPKGKNLIGAFYHPRLVLVDPSALLTLPARERTEGWAEVVKYGIILDAELFTQLEANADALRTFSSPPVELLCRIVARCIDLKALIIEEDEREQGRRAILNYGHTIAHALENVAGYGKWLHGEAVSLGMVVEAAMAHKVTMLTSDDMLRQNRLLTALGLPVTYRGAVQAQDILGAIQLDKKVTNKRVRWIMPQRIGEVIITHLPDDVVLPIVTEYFAEKR
ncbi:MAG: 3-dehydroquinate synthase [Ktedonobacteraceae bacterium]|nr:3-dehydroquinate synthase [Ktedonobacteraceae bacterium]